MAVSELNKIERSTLIHVPQSLVWSALTTSEGFSRWFSVEMEDSFAPGKRVDMVSTENSSKGQPFYVIVALAPWIGEPQRRRNHFGGIPTAGRATAHLSPSRKPALIESRSLAGQRLSQKTSGGGTCSWSPLVSMPDKRLSAGDANSAPVFAALGDETRLHLVARLGRDGPVSITNLASGSNISRQATSKHLNVLARAGLVRGLRQGRERLYQLDTEQIQRARQALNMIARQWDTSLKRPKCLVERGQR
jgi:DNA-binding transcriptional ArsR family regulator